jgi:quercetin dioxygenase-like cupin family protein
MKVTIFIFFVLVPAYFSVSGQTVRSATDDGAKPVILEKNEGELRVRRRPLGADNVALPVPTSEFMLKISPKNNDSQHLVMGTEQIPPGGRIRTHRHLEQDEILIIQTGEAHVHLGVREPTYTPAPCLSPRILRSDCRTPARSQSAWCSSSPLPDSRITCVAHRYLQARKRHQSA